MVPPPTAETSFGFCMQGFLNMQIFRVAPPEKRFLRLQERTRNVDLDLMLLQSGQSTSCHKVHLLIDATGQKSTHSRAAKKASSPPLCASAKKHSATASLQEKIHV